MSSSQDHEHSEPQSARESESARETSHVRQAFDRLRTAHRRQPFPSLRERLRVLGQLKLFIRENEQTIAHVISADFGHRSSHESRLIEVYKSIESIRYIERHVERWMRPEARSVPVTHLPGRAKVHFSPLGVVGVISPWNYPVQLAVVPMAFALSAGNRVLLKPSEHTPETSSFLARSLPDFLGALWVDVVTGGPEVAEEVAQLPLDHLVFTGSTTVGRRVMRAAAENLVPLTLELGGKSPAIVERAFPIDKAAERIAYAKWLSAGQTCVAPDHVFVHESAVSSFVSAMERVTHRFYPTIGSNPDYTAVISDRHMTRLLALVADAEAKGATKIEINPAKEVLPSASRKLFPTLLLDVRDDMGVMQDEIFGPVLPIVRYREIDEVLDAVNSRPRPLALYYFDLDPLRVERVLEATTSGGAAINDVALQWAVDDLPFGGVGPSGMGAYHGIEGFRNLSHSRGVFYQAKVNAAALVSPPFGGKIDRLLRLFIG